MGEDIVHAMTSGQELALIASVSKDPIWIGAIERNEDIHSIVAELMFGQKWKDATEPDCAYYKQIVSSSGQLTAARQKCSCKKHKPLRYDSKAIDFGLALNGT